MSKQKEFKEHQVDKLIMPWESLGYASGKDDKAAEGPKKDWLNFILNFTKRTEAGKWNDKYGVMIFKANYGYHSAMKKIVEDYVRDMKKANSNVVVMDETDDNRVRTWIVGLPSSIQQMVEDELTN